MFHTSFNLLRRNTYASRKQNIDDLARHRFLFLYFGLAPVILRIVSLIAINNERIWGYRRVGRHAVPNGRRLLTRRATSIPDSIVTGCRVMPWRNFKTMRRGVRKPFGIAITFIGFIFLACVSFGFVNFVFFMFTVAFSFTLAVALGKKIVAAKNKRSAGQKERCDLQFQFHEF